MRISSAMFRFLSQTMRIAFAKCVSIRLLYLLFLLSYMAQAQVTVSPAFPSPDEPVTITYNATQGTTQLAGLSPIYMHAGVITSAETGTSWQYVRGNWGLNDGVGRMQQVPGQPNLWRLTFVPRQYFNVPAGVPMFRIGMVFREAGPCGGSGQNPCREGKNERGQDIFVNLSQGFQATFTSPPAKQWLMKVGESLAVSFTASQDAALQLFQDGNPVSSAQGRSLNYSFSAQQEGQYVFVGAATRNGIIESDTLRVTVAASLQAELPSGAMRGINYLSDTEVLFVLEAPNKHFAHVIGDFNDWQILPAFQMMQTPDKEFFWLQMDGLSPGEEYIFQYLVDGQIRIADPYAAKISRGGPFGDAEIIAQGRYPGLKPYPSGKTEFEASYLQTNKPAFEWQHLDYEKPAPEDLVIYELLVRDFTDARSYAAVRERLPYLKSLGINALELMPIKEFEGNLSWGYNPAFFFAADKFYGPEVELKKLIDEAHGLGMVVLLDMVLNHAFGQNPMVRLYNEGDYGRPLPENPWFNVEPKHPFNVGYDFNHESKYTQFFVDTVNHYWLHEFRFDGYRYDLSKGFTQNNTGDNVAAWSAYDASRVALLKRMYDEVRKHHQDAYLILEHFADNSEERELSDYGFMLWGNMNGAGRALSRGESASLNGGWHVNRNWKDPHLVGYMESHDEERLMFESLNFGRTGGGLNLRNLPDAVDRQQMLAALFMSIPGPKMIWQFGEFGYDLELNNDRLGIKPTRWEYLDNADRRRLFDLHAFLFKEKVQNPLFKPDQANIDLGGSLKRVHLRKGTQHLFIFGNTGLSEQNFDITFPTTGTWYDVLARQETQIPVANQQLRLKPNQFYLLSTQPIALNQQGISRSEPFPNLVTSLSVERGVLQVFPNPASDRVFIRLPEDDEIRSVQLIDMQGRECLFTQTIRPEQEIALSISHLPEGLYIWKVKGQRSAYTGKILKK